MSRPRPFRPATILVAAVALLAPVLVAADKPRVEIPRVDRPPTLEDFLEMQPSPDWQGRLAHVEGFVQQAPEDGQPASQRTDVYLGYDDRQIYVIFVAFDDEPEKIRAHMSRRENVFDDEIVEVMFDTFNDEQRAYAFVATPLGIQWDAIWTEQQRFDSSWDTVWRSRGRVTDRGYVVRMAIPFRSLRFPATPEQTWGLVFVRDIPRNNESSFWPRVSNRIEGRMNQGALLTGMRDISPGRNLQLIPYAFAEDLRLRDPETRAVERDNRETEVGLDAKFVVRDSVTVDLTVNPDFSQVESDLPQVTVNQRFEVFFPEKRPFFLDNSDFFRSPQNLLFTRRIRAPRVGGRVTGKIGRWSLGALAIDDEAPGRGRSADDPLRDERAHVGTLRFTRDVQRQSKVGLIYTHRDLADRTNRVYGVDGRFKLDENWVAEVQAVRGETRTEDGRRLDDPAYDLIFNRSGRKFGTHLHYREVGRDFVTDLGFVPRTDIRDLHQSLEYTFRPEGRRLISWEPGLSWSRIEDHDGLRLDRAVRPRVSWEFRRQTRFGFSGGFGRERLRVSDLPDDSGPPPLEPLDFSTWDLEFDASTRFVKSFNGNLEVGTGKRINFVPPAGQPPAAADFVSSGAGFTARFRGGLRLDTSYLLLRLEDRASGARILTNEIVRTRWNLQLDPRLSIRAIVQHESTRVDPTRTRLSPDSRLNTDLLVTYLIDPWTAFYVGWNTNRSRTLESIGGQDRLGDYFRDGRSVFFKLSYLFR